MRNVVCSGAHFGKIWLSRFLLAVLGSQGIVVKFAAPIIFLTVDYSTVF